MYRFLLIATLFLVSCKTEQFSNLRKGIWRAELKISKSQVLPFNFEVIDDQLIKIFNADEVISVTDIVFDGDSVRIQTPVFEAYIKAAFDNERLSGYYIKEDLDRIVPFTANFGKKNRFDLKTDKPTQHVTGNWESVFSPNTDNAYQAKGIFEQQGQYVSGTFRTHTGDYRYLEGVMDGNEMKLSAFDGAHAFLFTATVKDSVMNGTFYSGDHWQEAFEAKKNDSFELTKADSLTFLKEGYDAISFQFPNENGEMISLEDERFKNKVVLVQIMGTWCPNCLDETKFYAKYFDANREKPLEIVALAFEYAKTKKRALQNIDRLKTSAGVNYPILLAQVGTSSKTAANEKLPMLNQILSYPTTIFIDKKGKVRKIHTGFNGPATGDAYTDFKNEFYSFMNQLLSEESK